MGITVINNTVKASKLFCDKLTLTFDYSNTDDQEMILNVINDMLHHGLHKSYYPTKVYKKCMKIYVGKVQKSTNAMLIQCDPKFLGIGFLRVDFNPAHADMDAVYALLIELLPGGLDDIALKAKITRIDVAVDLEGISPDQLLAYYPKMQVSAVFCKSGKTETLSMGCYGGNTYVTIYDKNQQIKDLNKKQHLNLPAPEIQTTRIEISLAPDCSLSKLAKIQNPFDKLEVKAFAYFFKVDEVLWRLFVGLAQFRGAQDALSMLDEVTRKKFKQRIENVDCPWWNPKSIWDGWEGLLIKVFGLKITQY